MSHLTLKHILAMCIVGLILVAAALIQDWWDWRKENRK